MYKIRTKPLMASDIHVWTAHYQNSPHLLHYYKSILSSDERNRSDKFKHTEDRTKYIYSHGILRILLESYTGIDRAAIVFQTNTFGKPYISLPGSKPFFFSLSHSGAMTAIACSSTDEIGIDIEHARSMAQIGSVASYLFSDSELIQYQKIPDNQKNQYVLHMWVRKEAYLKARGTGLSEPLKDIMIDPPSQSDKGCIVHPSHMDTANWIYYDLNVSADYIGALVYQGNNANISLNSWPY